MSLNAGLRRAAIGFSLTCLALLLVHALLT
jgi:hypothetical protein